MIEQNINQIISHITEKLLPQCKTKQEAESEAWWLLEFVLKKTQATLISQETITLSQTEEKLLNELIEKRTKKQMPLQYILKTVPFCSLEITVEPPILIPRPETEEWCAWLIEKLNKLKNKPMTILDIGSGSGCITLALAKALPSAEVIGIDINPDAITLGLKNQILNKIKNAKFIQSNIYNNLEEYKNKFDLIVSNPPYISEKEFSFLSKEVTLWEDKQALVANDEGFAIHKAILDQAALFLKKESFLDNTQLPRLLLECGKGQAPKLISIFKKANFKNITPHQDMERVERWITGTL